MRPEEMVGQKLSHYSILRPLGQGGSATVFLAQDIHLQRNVAIKVFLPREGDTQEFLRRFAREARVLAQLDHPNILPVYEYGEEEKLAFLAMPHMVGGSLRDWLRDRGMVSPQETIKLISQMLGALQYAHERNLIHRDIKPGNMLFKADGTLMLSDFGLVKVLTGEGGTSLLNDFASITTQDLTGTPDYMAPEQIQGKAVPASDIYAIGVVLYEMLTGGRLFDADNYIGILIKHMYEQPHSLSEINPQITLELEAVVLRALRKDPTQRYQRPIDLQQALLQAVRGDATLTLSKTADTTKVIPSDASGPPVSMPDRESSRENKNMFPMHLYTTQSTPVTPSSATQSDAHPAIQMPSPGPSTFIPASQLSAPSLRPGSSRALIIALLLIILVLIASLSGVLYAQGHMPAQPTVGTPQSMPTTGITPVDKGNTGPVSGNTLPVPPTQTSCPSSGLARALIQAPLVLGSHSNVVYIVNEGTPDHPTYGTIKRHEANFRTVAGVEISKMAGAFISEAQVSQDGQWVLFVVRIAGQSELRMVRVDGQGLQTLYCAPSNETISNSQWSFDQRTVVFNVAPAGGMPTMYLLDVTSGNLQAELIPRSTLAYRPRTWLDNTHIYMTGFIPDADGISHGLYLLDIKNGANQNDEDLQKVTPGLQPCGSFDSSYDSTQLLISSCELAPPAGGGTNMPTGPTLITSETVTGGPAKTIQTLQHAVTMLRTVRPTLLLLLVEDSSSDSSQNGLWAMNTDGTGLMRLTTDKQGGQSLCQFSQYAWSNVSRDGSMYALQEVIPNADANKATYNMYYGSLSGGDAYEFANIAGTQLLLAGWTSL